MHSGEMIIVTIVTLLAIFATYLFIQNRVETKHQH